MSDRGLFYIISIHAPTRGATEKWTDAMPQLMISIHAPTRGATWYTDDDYVKVIISIHAPTRGATITAFSHVSCLQFQSTLPHGERRLIIQLVHMYKNFNPRSHTGSDEVCCLSTEFIMYFNPRSHTGSDSGSVSVDPSSLNFNPRSHTGSDCNLIPFTSLPRDFNPRSHTGSDGLATALSYNNGDFNPRSHTGSDGLLSTHACCGSVFQSTLPHGERLNRIALIQAAIYFNPRSHTGSDSIGSLLYRQRYISIHAPTRGATLLS